MARAAELQRQHGLAMDPIPHLTEAADSHNSNTSKVTTGDMHYSLLVALKGIDVLPNGRYRVQLNTFMNGKKKFSRNSTDLYEVCPSMMRWVSFFISSLCCWFILWLL